VYQADYIIRLSRKKNILVIIDIVYEDFVLGGTELKHVQSKNKHSGSFKMARQDSDKIDMYIFC